MHCESACLARLANYVHEIHHNEREPLTIAPAFGEIAVREIHQASRYQPPRR